MATQIKLYYNTLITPEKNACVEDIETYLGQKQYVATELNKFIQHDLSLNLKLDTALISNAWTTGDALNPFNNARIDYVAIKNEKDSGWIYYYVLDGQWTATRTVTLSLALDTMTSFQGCYEFTDKTLVTREHKDRFINELKTVNNQTCYPRKFYLDGDNIQPTLYQQTDYDYIEDYDAPGDWYLMYMANNTSGATEGKDYPVNAYLVSGSNVSVGAFSYRLEVSTLDATKVYYCGSKVIGSYAESDYVVLPDGKKQVLDGIFFINKPHNSGKWQIAKALGNSNFKTIATFTNYLDFSSAKDLIIAPIDCILETLSAMPAAINRSKTGTKTPIKTASTGSVNGIETVDRTDTRILSIIKLPYAPVNININEETEEFQLPPEIESVSAITWQNQASYYYLKINANYLSAFEKEIKIPAGLLHNLFVKRTDLTSDTRKEDNESALYRSEFFNWKFTYDSFSYPLQYELLDESYKNININSTLPLKMVTTSTMNSRFLFDFSNNDKCFKFKHLTEDYPNILAIARNNNVTTFNSEYVNYMRNGYNYDVKAKNAALTAAGFNLAGNIIGLGAAGINIGNNIATSAAIRSTQKLIGNWQDFNDKATANAKLNPFYQKTFAGMVQNEIGEQQAKLKELRKSDSPVGNVLAIGQMTSSIGSIVNNINSIKQTERNFEQKQQQMKDASVSVSGSDDIDLLSYYSKNRMKLAKWQCSDRMRAALEDLYYYQGYATQEQKVPTHNNRKWFDFLQCNAELRNIKNIDQRFIEDIKDRLAIGVTYYHHTTNGWDINQTKGNNETWIS